MLFNYERTVVPFYGTFRVERSFSFYDVKSGRVELFVHVVGEARDPSSVFRLVSIRFRCVPARNDPTITRALR